MRCRLLLNASQDVRSRWKTHNVLFELQLASLLETLVGALLMTALIVLIVVLLLIGPLRRPYLRNWRFTFGATAAWIMGYIFSWWAINLVHMGPPMSVLMPLILPFGMAIIIGEAVKGWFDRVFPRDERNQRNEGHRHDSP